MTDVPGESQTAGFTREERALTVAIRKADLRGALANGSGAGSPSGAPTVSSRASLPAEMAEIAAAAGSVEQRADALLGSLRGVIPYAAAWIGVRDPETRTHRRVGSDGDVDSLTRYFARPEADVELESLGLNRFQLPVPASALPVPLADTLAWGEYLLPAGFDDGVAMALFTDDGRHLGFLSLLTGDSGHRTASYSALLASLRPIIVKALDRLPSFASAAQLTGDAVAGIAITRAGRGARVPGLPTHPLLVEGSAVWAVAHRYARAPGTVASFLSPWAGGSSASACSTAVTRRRTTCAHSC